MNKMLLFSVGNPPIEFLPMIPVDNSTSDTVMQDNALLDYIYGINPATGLPNGDLSFYLGENTRPEIRTFIEQNLMVDMSHIGKSPLDFPTDVVNQMRSTISDDDIAYFSRNHGETREEYASRIKTWLESERYRRIQEKRESDYQNELKELRSKIRDV